MDGVPKLDLGRMLAAREHIDPVFLDTPVVSDPRLNAALGCSLFVKDETRNPIKSFKGRGAELFASTMLIPRQLLVTASAGNFGQGLAWAVTRRGYGCLVFVASNANPVKIEAMRRLGAEVRQEGHDFDAAKTAARRFAAEGGRAFVEDGAEAAVAEGAGTVGLELGSSVRGLDVVLAQLGKGSLLAGVGAAMRHLAPRAKVIGVVAAAAPAMRESLAAGQVIETDSAETIAEGMAIRNPVPGAIAMLRGRFDDVVSVTDAQLLEAMRLVHKYLGLMSEPAGVAGVAAIMANPARFKGKRVGTILSGGNVAPQMWSRLQEAPAAA